MNKILTAVALACLCFSTDSFAAGFRLPDQDAAAMSMGGAFVGEADNPSAVWYNPAGITQLDGTRMSAGVIPIYPVLTHETLQGTTEVSEREVHYPFTLFATRQLNDRATFGLGITSPFGLSTNWSALSSTAEVATFSRIKSLDFNPNIAYRLNDSLSVAAGVDFYRVQATLQKMLPGGTELFNLDGIGYGWGANGAVLYKATDQMNIGLSYHSRVKVSVDSAQATVVGVPFTFTNTIKTEITLPDIMQLGLSYKLSDKTTLNGDIEYTWWSTYDRLVLESNTFLALTGGQTNTVNDEKQWKNTLAVRIGAQHALSDHWKVRAGYVYDQTPVPDAHFETRTPDSDRHGFTMGTGFTSGNTTVDLTYLYLMFAKRTINDSLADDTTSNPNSLNGTYKSMAHLFGVTVAYKF